MNLQTRFPHCKVIKGVGVMLKQIWPQNDFDVPSDEELKQAAEEMALLRQKLRLLIREGLIALNESERARQERDQEQKGS